MGLIIHGAGLTSSGAGRGHISQLQ